MKDFMAYRIASIFKLFLAKKYLYERLVHQYRALN